MNFSPNNGTSFSSRVTFQTKGQIMAEQAVRSLKALLPSKSKNEINRYLSLEEAKYAQDTAKQFCQKTDSNLPNSWRKERQDLRRFPILEGIVIDLMMHFRKMHLHTKSNRDEMFKGVKRSIDQASHITKPDKNILLFITGQALALLPPPTLKDTVHIRTVEEQLKKQLNITNATIYTDGDKLKKISYQKLVKSLVKLCKKELKKIRPSTKVSNTFKSQISDLIRWKIFYIHAWSNKTTSPTYIFRQLQLNINKEKQTHVRDILTEALKSFEVPVLDLDKGVQQQFDIQRYNAIDNVFRVPLTLSKIGKYLSFQDLLSLARVDSNFKEYVNKYTTRVMVQVKVSDLKTTLKSNKHYFGPENWRKHFPTMTFKFSDTIPHLLPPKFHKDKGQKYTLFCIPLEINGKPFTFESLSILTKKTFAYSDLNKEFREKAQSCDFSEEDIKTIETEKSSEKNSWIMVLNENHPIQNLNSPKQNLGEHRTLTMLEAAVSTFVKTLNNIDSVYQIPYVDYGDYYLGFHPNCQEGIQPIILNTSTNFSLAVNLDKRSK